jgi:hypothetical protein
MLEITCEKVPKHDQIIILGNFNAQIGEDETKYNISGRYTLHPTSNGNGSLLIQFVLRNNLYTYTQK